MQFQGPLIIIEIYIVFVGCLFLKMKQDLGCTV